MEYERNKKIKADGLDLMESIGNSEVAAVFFDPQYRGVLDKLGYGNEGKNRGQARSSLTQMPEDTIIKFVSEINRVLRDSGHMFLWVDKFHLCQGVHSWFAGTELNLVDMVVWDKGKIGMGYRTRRRSEFLLIFQKSPVRAKGIWTDHTIPDVWCETLSKAQKNHPHTKPIELQKRLIQATTATGDLVLDPAAGGYSVLQACIETERNFIGCDIEFGE